MNLNHLIYFQALAKYEHYGKAAEKLNITQPSLSKAIRKMEEELGISCFEKMGRGVRLTSQGQRYLEYVNEALNGLEHGREALHYEQIPSGGYMNIGLTPSVAVHEFTAWIRGFQEAAGKTVFYSCVNSAEDALSLELKTGKLELILCSPFPDPKIEFTPLVPRPLMLVVPAGHRFFGRSSVDIHELNGEKFIAHSRHTVMHKILAEVYQANNVHVVLVSEADADLVILSLIRTGIGCGVLDYPPEIPKEDYRAIPIINTGFCHYVGVGRKKNVRLTGLAEQFYEYLVSQSRTSIK